MGMNLLVEKAQENCLAGVFTYSDVLVWLGGTRNSVRCRVMRAIDAGDILPIRRGLYCLAPRYTFYMAKPLKALADYVASRGLDWIGLDPLVESLRIEDDGFESLKSSDFDELDGVYKSARARKFLAGVRKELGK